MRHFVRIIANLTIVLASLLAGAQSTSVSLSVTDTGSVAWANGTYKLTFLGPQNPIWPGGTLNPNVPITGTLSGSGTATISVPDNNTISPSGTQWKVQGCSATLPVACSEKRLTITGASQSVTITPTAISIPVPTTPTYAIAPVTAYADAEIAGGWTGYTYYNLTSSVVRVCATVASNTCSAWAGAGGAATPGGSSGQIQWNNLGAFGGIAGSSVTTNGNARVAPSGAAVAGVASWTVTGDSAGDDIEDWCVYTGGGCTNPIMAVNSVGALVDNTGATGSPGYIPFVYSADGFFEWVPLAVGSYGSVQLAGGAGSGNIYTSSLTVSSAGSPPSITGTLTNDMSVGGSITGPAFVAKGDSSSDPLYEGKSNAGNLVWQIGPLGADTPASYASLTNCAANGTAASPSVVSCSAAPAGSFSCATNASGATCVIDTSAITANSEIFITQRADTTTGTRLTATCNTTSTSALVTAVTAGTSFTLTLGSFTTHPLCFSYFIVN